MSKNAQSPASSQSEVVMDGDHRAILDAVPSAQVMVDIRGRITFMNRSAEALLGGSREKSVGHPFQELIPERFRRGRGGLRSVFRAAAEVREMGADRGMFLLTRNRGEIPVEMGINRVQFADGSRLLATVIDLSERVLTQERYAGLLKRLNLATESANTGIWEFDLEKKIAVWDDRMYEIYGIRPGDFGSAAEAWEKCVHPEDLARVKEEIRSTLAQAHKLHTRFRVVWPSGEVRHVEARSVVERDESGVAFRIVGVNWDTTDRLEDEARLATALKRAEEAERTRAETLFEHAGIPILEEDYSALKVRLEEIRGKGVSDFDAYFSEHPKELRKCAALIKITRVNKRALEYYGIKRFEDFEPAIALWFTEESWEVFQRELVAIADGNMKFAGVIPLRSPSGEAVAQILNLTILPDAVATWERVIATFVDVTQLRNATAAADNAELRFRTFFELSPNGILLIDPASGSPVEFNDTACRLLGYDRETFARLSLRDYDNGQSADELADRLRRAMESGQAAFEARHQTATGEFRTTKVTWQKVTLDGNDRIFALHVDVTDRRRAEDELRTQLSNREAMFEHAGIPIWEEDFSLVKAQIDALRERGVVDLDAYFRAHPEDLEKAANGVHVVRTNRMANDWMASVSAGADSAKVAPWFTKNTWSVFREEIVAFASGKSGFQGELEVRTPNGDLRTLLINLAILPERAEQWSRVFYSFLDITERKETEQQVRRLHEDLERHAAELEQRVAERTAKLEEVNGELTAFAYSVSHDLRAPLRAMQGMSVALVEDHANVLPESGKDFARRIRDAAFNMDQLIQDMLAYSRVSRSEVTLRHVDLGRAVAEAVSTMAVLAKENGAVIVVAPDMQAVMAHPSVLGQALVNLIGNAIKFVPKGRQPRVRIFTEAVDGVVRLWVEDNGIGIEPAHHDRIFRVFERLHGIEEYPGTGIGLAIVRKGMERMGGNCGVESIAGKGSRFWIQLPSI